MTTFKIEGDDEGLVSRRDRHPNTLSRPHRGAGKRSIHKVIKSETLANRLLACDITG